MSDKVHAGEQSKSSKELFREGLKAIKDGLRNAETLLSDAAPLEAKADELLGDGHEVGLTELPQILFKLSQSTSVGAVITSPNGDELMANPTFYKLTSQTGGAGGAVVVMRDKPDGNQITPPWVRASATSQTLFERLYCDGSDNNNGRHVDFYCRPLLNGQGQFEGAFTLASDSTEEVSRHDRLRELVGAVEAQVSSLKAASDELSLFLKNQTRRPESKSGLNVQSSSRSSASTFAPASGGSKSEDEGDADSESEPADVEVAADTAESSEHTSSNDILNVSEAGNSQDEFDNDADFDPDQLQAVADSASAFILDQGMAPFPEVEDEGPEKLWQEMSDGLADVLNSEDNNASSEAVNMTILEDRNQAARKSAAGQDKGERAEKNDSSNADAPASSDKAPAFLNADGQAARCLVVDDIPVNQKLLVFQLKRFGLDIDTASSGNEALDMVARKQYEIIFMDCDMPGMNGFETTSEIRQRHEGVKLPIIGMTSHDRDGDKQKCLRAGMDDALHKGVSEQELRKTIATALGVDEAPKQTEVEGAERNFEPQELEELIQTFMYAMEMFVSSMQRAIDEKDSGLVRELASSVSGPSRVLGLHDMNKVSQEMVRLSSSGDWPQVRLKYLRLKTVYMRCQDDLRKLCPQAFSQAAAR